MGRPSRVDDLIEAARQLVEREGEASVTLQRVSALAGPPGSQRPSQVAALVHFGTRRGLLARVAAEGWRELAEAMEACRARAGDRLVACVETYVRFALAHPHLHRLMHAPQLWSPADHGPAAPSQASSPDRQRKEQEQLALLARGRDRTFALVAEAAADPRVPPAEVWPRARLATAIADGFIRQFNDERADDALDSESKVALVRAMVEAGLRGLQAGG